MFLQHTSPWPKESIKRSVAMLVAAAMCKKNWISQELVVKDF